MKDPDRAYDEHRQDCTDAGICHFCEDKNAQYYRDQWARTLEIAKEYEAALRYIATMQSCLLAHAQEVARNVLETDND